MNKDLGLILLIIELYSLLSLWIFFFLYKFNIINSIKSHSSGTLQEKKFDFKHISEIHSSTISGRGSLSHYWTLLGMTNLLIGFLLNTPLLGIEQIGLILLPIYPLHSNHDKICGFVKLEPYIVSYIHYICVSSYLILSFIVFALGQLWIDFYIQFILSITTILLLLKNNNLAIHFEALSSTYISLFYTRILISKLNN